MFLVKVTFIDPPVKFIFNGLLHFLNEAAMDDAIAPVPQLRVSPSTPFSKVLTLISFLLMISTRLIFKFPYLAL